jgi:regulatory protein
MLVIEKIVFSKKDGDSFRLKLSDGSSLGGLDQGTLKRLALIEGRELNETELAELSQIDALHRGKATAARFLAFRPRSQYEVRNRLARAGIDEVAAAQIVTELLNKGSIDDSSFARQWARGKVLNGTSGEKLIRKQLMQRGVAARLIEEILAEELPREAALEAACLLAEKRLARIDQREPGERKKVQDYLLRRGYSWDVVAQAMKGKE